MSQSGPLNLQSTIPPEVPTEFVTNSGTAIPIANIIEIIGSGGSVTTSGSGNTVTISVTAGAFTWNSVTSLSPPNPIQIVAENGYVCDGVSQVTFILPLAPNFGDEFIIISNTSTFMITQNGSQSMRIGAQVTTPGSGSITSNTVGDYVQFVYVGGNKFLSFASQGTFTII